MTITVLQPDTAGFNHLLITLIHTRVAVAAKGDFALLRENGYAKEMSYWLANDQIQTLLAELISGQSRCDAALWLNLANMVKFTPEWAAFLTDRGVRMATPDEAFAQAREVARSRQRC